MLPPSCVWDNRRVQQGLTGWRVFLPHGQTSSLTHSVRTASPAPVPPLVSRLSPGCERGQQGQQPPWLPVNTAAQDPQRPARRLRCQNPSVGAALHPCQHTEDKHTALSHMLPLSRPPQTARHCIPSQPATTAPSLSSLQALFWAGCFTLACSPACTLPCGLGHLIPPQSVAPEQQVHLSLCSGAPHST